MEAHTIQLPMHTSMSRSTCTAKQPWYLMVMMMAPLRRIMRINIERERRLQTKVDIPDTTKFVGKKGDFLSNCINKHSLIQLISKRLQEKGCHTIQAEVVAKQPS